MRQRTALDRRRRGEPIIDSSCSMEIRDRCYPFLMLLTRTKVRFRLRAANTYQALPEKPVIFAANHSAFPDTPIALRAIGRHAYIYAGRQRLPFADWLFFALNGTVWVDRKDREDMAFSKEALQAYLGKGQPILWFPEGTWNLTAAQLMMPMKWGIIDVAREAGAQIVPMTLDYDRETMECSVKFGQSLAGEDLADKARGIRKLRDAMATLRWELMERHPVLRREEASAEALWAEVHRAIEEYPAIDWGYEKGCIYRPG